MGATVPGEPGKLGRLSADRGCPHLRECCLSAVNVGIEAGQVAILQAVRK